MTRQYYARSNDEGSSSSNGEPQWQGRSYSWTPPRRRNQRTLERIHLNHAGDIAIRQEQPPASSSSSSSSTGLMLWSAAYCLAHYIDEQCGSSAWNVRAQHNNYTCLELGARLGLPSIVAAKHGFSCLITENDPHVLPILESNLERNLPNDIIQSEKVQVQSLDWNNHGTPIIDGPYPDLILASDLIYKDTRPSWSALAKLLGRLQRPSNHQRVQRRFDGRTTGTCDPLILLGYTHRSRNLSLEEQREFFRLLDREGIYAHPIPNDKIPGCEERILTTIFELRSKDNAPN